MPPSPGGVASAQMVLRSCMAGSPSRYQVRHGGAAGLSATVQSKYSTIIVSQNPRRGKSEPPISCSQPAAVQQDVEITQTSANKSQKARPKVLTNAVLMRYNHSLQGCPSMGRSPGIEINPQTGQEDMK